MNEKLEKYRNTKGLYKSKKGDSFGLFFIPILKSNITLKVISSPLGKGEWDHVSVSLPNRCPTWKEMCFIKDLFWEDDDTVIQFHPPKKDYVNNHPFCLHLWKFNGEFPRPHWLAVGIK